MPLFICEAPETTRDKRRRHFLSGNRIPACIKGKNGKLKSWAFSTATKEAKIAGEAQERCLILMLITTEPSEVRTQQSTGISTLSSSAHIICFHRQTDWKLKRLKTRNAIKNSKLIFALVSGVCVCWREHKCKYTPTTCKWVKESVEIPICKCVVSFVQELYHKLYPCVCTSVNVFIKVKINKFVCLHVCQHLERVFCSES